MNLTKFRETYMLLEQKARAIMEIYGYDNDNYTLIAIKSSGTGIDIVIEEYYSGCHPENIYLEFTTEELNNGLPYFAKRRDREITEEKLKKELRKQHIKDTEEKLLLKQYESLKKKFG